MIRLFIAFAIATFSIQTYAFFEPYAGYNAYSNYSASSGSGTGIFASNTPGNSTGSLQDSVAVGFRVGFSAGPMLFGLEYENTLSTNFSANAGNDHMGMNGLKATLASLGLVLGAQISNFRIWVGGYPVDSLDYSSGGNDFNYFGGFGYKIGLGYPIYSHMCLNVEYMTHSYGYLTVAGSGNVIPGTVNDLKGDTIQVSKMDISTALVSLSFPFWFGETKK